MKRYTVVGAGLVGSLLSLYLSKKGHQVDVYERRKDPRKNKKSEGRSINLALSERGWASLKEVGIEKEVLFDAIPMYRRVMHDIEGKLSYQDYGKNGQAIYSVSRGGLNRLLIEKAESKPNIKISFDHKCIAANLNDASVTFEHQRKTNQIKNDAVFGTDGAFSKIRLEFQKRSGFSYSQDYIEHGYKELNINPGPEGSFKLEKEALHIWPRGGYMLIALPNPDGSFTCTLFFPMKGELSFESLDSSKKAKEFMSQNFGDALELMEDFENQWNTNPTSSLVIIKCDPWNVKGKSILLGDASHAIVPFYGQGMNSGFEDCRVLYEIMEKSDSLETAFESFSITRKPDADAISDLAMQNFVEMRDLTGQPDFLLRKKIENNFSNLYPDKWMPLYSQVTFSQIRYSKALAEGKKQDAIMQKVMKIQNIEKLWNSEEVNNFILNSLK